MKHARNLRLYKSILVATLVVSLFFTASAQQAINCAKLLKRDISKDSVQQIMNNFKQADCFGLDKVDKQLLLDAPSLGLIMVNYATKHTGKITYADILAELNKTKSDTGYTALRNLKVAQNTLEATKGSAETWESSKKFLLIIGMPESEMENFHQYVLLKQAHGWNYRQLVTAYQMSKDAGKK